MRAINLATAVRLAGPDSEWASGSTMTWTTDSDEVLVRLALRRESRRTGALVHADEEEKLVEEPIGPAGESNALTSLVLRECGWNAALEAMLKSNEQDQQLALLRLLARSLVKASSR